MPRIRTIKPEFWESESVARVSFCARLLFIGLWNFADDAGRLRGTARFIKAKVFPYDADMDADPLLQELSNEGLIIRYEVEKEQYICIPKFLKHQKIDRPQPSSIPAPSDSNSANSTNNRRTINERSPQEWNGMDMEGKGIGAEKAGTRESSAQGLAQHAPAAPPLPENLDAYAGIPFEQFDNLRRKGYSAQQIANAKAEVAARIVQKPVTRWDRYLISVLEEQKLCPAQHGTQSVLNSPATGNTDALKLTPRQMQNKREFEADQARKAAKQAKNGTKGGQES